MLVFFSLYNPILFIYLVYFCFAQGFIKEHLHVWRGAGYKGAAFVTQLHFPNVTRSMNGVGIYPYSVNFLA